jgi:hypothetical protein
VVDRIGGFSGVDPEIGLPDTVWRSPALAFLGQVVG